MAGKLSGSAIQTGTITSTQLSSELGPVSSELQLVGSGISLNVSNTAVFSGNVGIGTTSPTVKLSVDGSVVFNESGADVDFRVEGDTDANLLFVDASANNIGIGTDSPTRKLHISSSGTNCAIRIDNTASGRPFILAYDDSQNLTITNSSDSGYIALVNGTGSGIERMRLTANGELLVGGTTEIGNAAGRMTVEGSNINAVINLFRNDTSIVAGNALGAVDFYGNHTTSNTATLLARILGVASGDHAASDNPTDITFWTSPDGTATPAESGRITQAGSYVLKGGTVTNAAGVGVIFPATQVASANPNSLDDYEEGTWTPALATGTATYTSRTGTYTKIGNRVILFFEIRLATLSGSGSELLTGCPFTPSGEAGATGVVMLTSGGSSLSASYSGVFNNDTNIYLYTQSATERTNWDVTNLTASAIFSGTIVFKV